VKILAGHYIFSGIRENLYFHNIGANINVRTLQFRENAKYCAKMFAKNLTVIRLARKNIFTENGYLWKVKAKTKFSSTLTNVLEISHCREIENYFSFQF
jgi:hypothetical protein